MPMVKVEKHYVFEGPNGPITFDELFDGKRQLILYHFMFGTLLYKMPSKLKTSLESFLSLSRNDMLTCSFSTFQHQAKRASRVTGAAS